MNSISSSSVQLIEIWCNFHWWNTKTKKTNCCEAAKLNWVKMRANVTVKRPYVCGYRWHIKHSRQHKMNRFKYFRIKCVYINYLIWTRCFLNNNNNNECDDEWRMTMTWFVTSGYLDWPTHLSLLRLANNHQQSISLRLRALWLLIIILIVQCIHFHTWHTVTLNRSNIS